MSRINNSLLRVEPAPQPGVAEDAADFTSPPPAVPGARSRRARLASLTILTLLSVGFAGSRYLRRPTPAVAPAPVPPPPAKPAAPVDQARLGVKLFKTRDYQKALAALLAALPEHGKDPWLLVDIGMVYKARHDFASARKYYQAAIAQNAGYAPAYNNLAMLSAEEKDWASAIRQLKKALSIDPALPAALLNLAKAYEHARKWPLARGCYSQYLALADADPLVKSLIEKRLNTSTFLRSQNPIRRDNHEAIHDVQEASDRS